MIDTRRGLVLCLSLGLTGFLTGSGTATGAPDDYLHPSHRELSAAERRKLEEVVGELGNPDPYLRNLAVRRLAVIGRPAIPSLREVVERGSDPKRISMACLALGAIGEPECFAILHRFLQSGEGNEDKVRGAIIGLSRESGYMPPESAKEIRRLVKGGSRDTVTMIASLVASSRDMASLASTIEEGLRGERSPTLRATYLLALAETGDESVAKLIERELKKNRNRLVRRACLYAAARLRSSVLFEPLLRFRPVDEERNLYVLALAVYPDAKASARITELLTTDREEVADAVFALAELGNKESLETLQKAIEGEFGDVVRAAACLAITELTDQQRFLPGLREAALHNDPTLRHAALLALARLKDEVSATHYWERLDRLSDPLTLQLALILCAGMEEDPCARVPERFRRGAAVGPLCTLIEEVRDGRRDPRILVELVRGELAAAAAHHALRLERHRRALTIEALELDRINFNDPDDDDGSGLIPPEGPGAPGGETGGEGEPGGEPGGEGGEPGGETGGEGGEGGEGEGEPDDSTPPPGGTNAEPGGFAGLGFGTKRRSTSDYARFEFDLLLWWKDFPLFHPEHPFADG